MPEDSTDRHVARWRNRPELGIAFDDEVEAIITRIQRLARAVSLATRDAARSVGLEEFEYKTLHSLMIRDTPGHASPSDLAADLGISNAGMTGRLDALATAGWVTRTTGVADRRRVEIAITDAGLDVWQRAGALVGEGEDALVHALPPEDRAALSAMLKKLALVAESPSVVEERAPASVSKPLPPT